MTNVNNYLEKCVSEYPRTKNINNVRTAIIGIISADPTFSTSKYDEAINYVTQNNIELFEKLDEEGFPPIEKVKSQWDKSYFARATIYCENNFCHERINHLKEVGKQVFESRAISNSSGSYGGDLKNLEGRQLEQGEEAQNKLPVWLISLAAVIVIIVIIVAM